MANNQGAEVGSVREGISEYRVEHDGIIEWKILFLNATFTPLLLFALDIFFRNGYDALRKIR